MTHSKMSVTLSASLSIPDLTDKNNEGDGHAVLTPPLIPESLLSSTQVPYIHEVEHQYHHKQPSIIDSIAIMAIGIFTKPSALGVSHNTIPNVGPCQQNRFDELVVRLKDALGPSSGLTSDDVDVDFLQQLMEGYDGADNMWKPYAIGDRSRGYTRNLVDEGNGKSNLLVLVWSPGKGSPIHDHGNAHCLMKILKGNLTETRYAFPNEDEQDRPMNIIGERTYKENSVAYMADELGLHRVSNRGSDFAVSLHLYTPPNVAKKGCHIFDEKTGRKSHVPGCHYYSAYGRLLKE